MPTATTSALSSWCRSERIRSCCLARILLAIMHLLEKGLCFLLVHKGEAGEAILRFERVEKRPVLIIVPCIVNLLVPYHSPVCGLRGDQHNFISKIKWSALNLPRYPPVSANTYCLLDHSPVQLRLEGRYMSIYCDLDTQHRVSQLLLPGSCWRPLALGV